MMKLVRLLKCANVSGRTLHLRQKDIIIIIIIIEATPQSLFRYAHWANTPIRNRTFLNLLLAK